MKAVLTILLSYIASLTLFAGPLDFTVKVFGLEEDFGGIFIYTIAQDHDGFIWVGSDDGLYRFDGVELINYNKKDSTISSLVTASTVSTDGQLYFGYFKGGVSKMVHGSYQEIFTHEDFPGKIVSLTEDRFGNIWALSQNKGLVSISKEGKFSQHPAGALQGKLAYSMVLINDRLIIAGSEGLSVFKTMSGGVLDYIGNMEAVKSQSVLSLLSDVQRGMLWVGTDGDGVLGIPVDDAFEKSPLQRAASRQLLNSQSVTAMGEDDLGSLWVGTKSDGLIQVDLNEGTAREEKYTYFNEDNGFIGNEVNTVLVDRENEVWVGSFGHGFAQLNRAEFHHYELGKRFKIHSANGFAQNDDFSMLIATDQGLLKAATPYGSDTLVFEKLPLRGVKDQNTTVIFRSENGVFWLGTRDRGLYWSNDELASFQKVDLGKVDGLNETIRTISEDPDGNLWVSVVGNGLLKLSSNGTVLQQFNTRNGFYHNEIYYSYTDSHRRTWVAAHLNGLAVIEANGEIKYLTKDNVFPSRDVNSITEAADGVLWIATYGDGIFQYVNGEFTHLGKEDGLLSNYCNSVRHDKGGNVWISHREGLTFINLGTSLIRTFKHKRELGETEIVINSSFIDDLGNLWFGNPYGVTKVILPHINFVDQPSITHITDLRVFFKKVDLLMFSKQEALDDILPNDLNLPFNQNHITFDYVAINLRKPNAVFYRYKLNGYDEEWSPVTKVNEATYTNLDPGDYEFTVQESYSPGYWSQDFSSIQFTISSPYWLRWWFYLLEIFFVAAMLWVTFLFVKKLQNRLVTKLMIFTAVFTMFEFVHNQLEPFFEKYTQEAPFMQVFMHLGLALLLFPIENSVTYYFERKRKRSLSLAEVEEQKN
ncbi:two-component regulator propeller domain-containing protein [uncultured Imperialibacter sp.]|uniref:ligand-binding sensor domain-containing protein n=1 Tax=uncultured Imperialibacter sp. TaxID=1672639 RepID=UPI0030D70F88|tara:strand:- start:1050 stop:3665 length:2616 start_codon:yes stop_codon:yes gene_type:complete